ncbi:hypothetical protein C9F11_39750 [Streptomyces sp. YIM 121038]|nr:hypothetical protein C9F11_39750 [Streptomyces sp. YIM 121038]
MKDSETHALPSRRQVLRVGAAAAVAAGVPTIAAPGTHASERSARGRNGVPDGTTFMAWKGVTGDEQVWWNRWDNGSWSVPQRVPGALSSAGVALAGPPGGPLYLTWRGSGEEGIWVARFDGSSWTWPERVPDANGSVGPALAPYAGVFQAWKGVTGDQRIWWNRWNGGWSGNQVVPGANSSFGPALAFDRYGTGVPHMVWKGSEGDERIWWNRYLGGGSGSNNWTGPEAVPAATTRAGVALASPPEGGLYLAWKSTDAEENILYSRLSGNTWLSPRGVPGARSSVGPALAVNSGYLYATWKGVTGDEQVWWSRLVGNTWSVPQQVGGARSSFRPALATIGS